MAGNTVSREQKEAFIRAIATLIEERGGNPLSSGGYTLSTPLGEIWVTPYAESSPWVYVQFRNLELARQRFGSKPYAIRDLAFNPITGKYNHHYDWSYGIERCVEDFKASLEQVFFSPLN